MPIPPVAVAENRSLGQYKHILREDVYGTRNSRFIPLFLMELFIVPARSKVFKESGIIFPVVG